METTASAFEREDRLRVDHLGRQLPPQGRTLQKFPQSQRGWLVRIQGGMVTAPKRIFRGSRPETGPYHYTAPCCINRLPKVDALPVAPTEEDTELFPGLADADCFGDEAEWYPDTSFGVPDSQGGFQEAPSTNQDANQVNEEPADGPPAF